MGKHNTTDFIVIDDDFITNAICQKIIQSAVPQTKIDIFTNPQKGLEHIHATYSDAGSNNAVLFLDINMPALNAWDVLDHLKNAPIPVKHHLKIFILSSSVTPHDKQKAADDPLVSGCIEKPLTLASLQNIIADVRV